MTPIEVMLHAFAIDYQQTHNKKCAMRAALLALVEMEPTPLMAKTALEAFEAGGRRDVFAACFGFILAAANEGEKL